MKVNFSGIEMYGEVLKLIRECTFEIALWGHGFVPDGIASTTRRSNPFEGVRTVFCHSPGESLPRFEINSLQIDLIFAGLGATFLISSYIN